MTYDDAVRELYQAPLAEFVATRKRLAGELRAAGERNAASRLTGRGRPPVSAWVVNQLYWHARDAFDAMLATAARLRQGEVAATADHREAIARLRQRASAILTHAEHTATETTLRRVTTTLAAIAAVGGFDPDLPGTLAEDRDPPGFEAAGLVPVVDVKPATKPAAKVVPRPAHDELANRRAAAEQARAEAERARVAAERKRLETALRAARAEVETREHHARTTRQQLRDADESVANATKLVDELERKLADLEDGN